MDPRAPGWASGERERHNFDGHKSGGQNIIVSVRSSAPPHSKNPHNLFEPLQIKWEVHIFIKKSSCVRLLFIASECILHESAYDYIISLLDCLMSYLVHFLADVLILYGDAASVFYSYGRQGCTYIYIYIYICLRAFVSVNRNWRKNVTNVQIQ